MAITYFNPKTARGSVDCRRCHTRRLRGKGRRSHSIEDAMAPIPLKAVVSATSEDCCNPASNLLSAGAAGKWLTAAGRSGSPRSAEVLIELAKKSRITSLEICNFGSAFVEVLVSCGGADECTLLPSMMLMTVMDSRAGRSRTKTLTVGRERLSHAAMEEKWSHVRIVCRQPYSQPDVQFGLQYILLYSDSRTSTPLLPSHTPSPHTTLTPSHSPAVKSPLVTTPLKLPPRKQRTSSSTPARTPKGTTEQNISRGRRRQRRRSSEPEDFEFHGLERQSRLFTNAVRGKGESPSKAGNSVLERIMQDPEKFSLPPPAPPYQRQRLLTKELPKADTHTDFTASYKANSSKNTEMSGACRRMSAHDNDHEIGMEPERTWGWGNRKRKNSSSSSGWIHRNKQKLDSVNDNKCCDITSRGESGEKKTPGTIELIMASRRRKPEPERADREATGKVVGVSANEGAPSFVECPLCGLLLPLYAIELHASTCGDVSAAIIIN